MLPCELFCKFPINSISIPGFPGADKLPQHNQMSGQIIENKTDEGLFQAWPRLVGTGGDDLVSWEPEILANLFDQELLPWMVS